MAVSIGSYEIFNIKYSAKVQAILEVLNGLSFKNDNFPYHWMQNDFQTNIN
jgi:hypothetical protein